MNIPSPSKSTDSVQELAFNCLDMVTTAYCPDTFDYRQTYMDFVDVLSCRLDGAVSTDDDRYSEDEIYRQRREFLAYFNRLNDMLPDRLSHPLSVAELREIASDIAWEAVDAIQHTFWSDTLTHPIERVHQAIANTIYPFLVAAIPLTVDRPIVDTE